MVGLTKVTIRLARIKVHVQPKTYKSWVLAPKIFSLNLAFVEATSHVTHNRLRSSASQFTTAITYKAAMAEAPEVITIQDEDEQERGPCNLITADEYAQSLDNIMLQFKELVLEDRKDPLQVTINALK